MTERDAIQRVSAALADADPDLVEACAVIREAAERRRLEPTSKPNPRCAVHPR